MSTPSVYTLTNPKNGNLAFKIFGFREDNPLDHLQRLPYYTLILLVDGHAKLHADFTGYDVGPRSLLFFAPYQPFMLRDVENINGSVMHFHADFFVFTSTKRRSRVTAYSSIKFTFPAFAGGDETRDRPGRSCTA